MKDEHERKMKLHETTIQKFKHRQKELEKTLKDKSNGDRRLAESQQEIEKLNMSISSLKKKVKDGKLCLLTHF